MVYWCLFSYDFAEFNLPFNKSDGTCVSPDFAAGVTHAFLQISNYDRTKISNQF